MFIKHGIVGFILVITFQLILILKIESFGRFYFPFIWFGYIFVIDAIVYQLINRSLIHNHSKKFFIMLILSALFWWLFEGINYFEVKDWHYINGSSKILWVSVIYRTFAFSTVLPAIWETYDLVKALHLFDKQSINIKYKITKNFLYSMIVIGIISFILPFFAPQLAFPLVWLSFFLILDPINYINHQPSIIKHLKNGKFKIPLSLMLSGLICGFFWEFWNYWAPVKWVYNIPYVGFFKIFEMPILGYLGYLFFAWELYAMYHFCMGIIKKNAM